jgi:hypothetical protein
LGPDFLYRLLRASLLTLLLALFRRTKTASSRARPVSCTGFKKCSSVALLLVQLRGTKPVSSRSPEA